jgi:hypothetical protein
METYTFTIEYKNNRKTTHYSIEEMLQKYNSLPNKNSCRMFAFLHQTKIELNKAECENLLTDFEAWAKLKAELGNSKKFC